MVPIRMHSLPLGRRLASASEQPAWFECIVRANGQQSSCSAAVHNAKQVQPHEIEHEQRNGGRRTCWKESRDKDEPLGPICCLKQLAVVRPVHPETIRQR